MNDDEMWTLRSGRWVTVPRAAMAQVFLEMQFASELIIPVSDGTDDENDAVTYDKDEPLTDDERRELADAAIAAWNRWAETGSDR